MQPGGRCLRLSLQGSQGPGRRVAAGREKEGMGEKDEDRKKERKKKKMMIGKP